MEASYQRPIKATLHVHLATGEQWAVTEADLDNFGLVDRRGAYATFDDILTAVLTKAKLLNGSITTAQLNPVRYLVETAIVNPDLLYHPEHRNWDYVCEIERRLQDTRPAEIDHDDD